MEPVTSRDDLPPEHVHPYWIGRAYAEGRVTLAVAAELLAELPLGPPAWGPDGVGTENLLDAQMEAGCWNIAFPLMLGGDIDVALYGAAVNLRRQRGLRP